MVQIMAKVIVKDLQTFLGVFATKGAMMRRKYGCLSATVYQLLGNESENQLMLIFEWESRDRFEAFVGDPAVKETMKSGGTLAPPEFTFLNEIARFPG